MKIGFIGGGNMGGAIIGGIINAGITDKADIIVSDKSEAVLSKINSEYGVSITSDNKTAASSDILFLCIKPQFVYPVIDEIKNSVDKDTVIVSIVAGQSIEALCDAFGKTVKLIRVMPNTPALVGEGMTAIAPNENVSDKETEAVMNIFCSLGKCETVTENLMDAVTAVSGSSPAYVFMLIEAMADAAVAGGMPRSQAYTFAAQAVLGSAKMVLETGKHPGELKDMVCSPAGTTIDAVAMLEKTGFRSSVIEAMHACVEKSKQLGKK
ncbi:MAG: pyrroline-5-carboxylate reductase [Oscillospiraceae bacterium]|nr:pyrroline-5-carboxylate reductase [Oscillospiraceae bacterium]